MPVPVPPRPGGTGPPSWQDRGMATTTQGETAKKSAIATKDEASATPEKAKTAKTAKKAKASKKSTESTTAKKAKKSKKSKKA